MKNIGKILHTYSAQKGQSGLPRPLVEKLTILKGYGIQDDKFAGYDLDKSVMIVGLKAYEIARQHDIHLIWGSMGENITFDFNPHDYPIGSIFKINSVVLQVTQKCTICKHLAVFNASLPFLVRDVRGLYCKVLEGGIIERNQKVEHVIEYKVNKKIAS